MNTRSLVSLAINVNTGIFSPELIAAIALTESGGDFSIAPHIDTGGQLAYGAFQINEGTAVDVGIIPANSNTPSKQIADVVAVLLVKHTIAINANVDDPMFSTLSLYNGGFHNHTYVAKILNNLEKVTSRKIKARDLDPGFPESRDHKDTDNLRKKMNIAVVSVGVFAVAIFLMVALQ